MELRKATWVVLKGCLFILAVAAFAACQGSLFSYRGATAEQGSRITLLEGGPHVGSWKTKDLSMDYEYFRDRDSLEFSGIIELDDSLKYNFRSIDYLFLQVSLLDAEGKVLETKGAFSSDYSKMIEKFPFNRNLKLPSGTAAMAFSYRGRVREGGGTGRALKDAGDGDSWDFWMTPFRSRP